MLSCQYAFVLFVFLDGLAGLGVLLLLAQNRPLVPPGLGLVFYKGVDYKFTN